MLTKLFGKSKQHMTEIYSPISGQVMPLTAVPDEAFAGKHMGDGIAIQPTDGKVIAPFDGKVTHLIHTNHAIVVEHPSGVQLLIHIGINTVALKGEAFTAHVSTGDSFKAGDLLIEFDIDAITKGGYPTITPVVVANEDEVKRLEHAISSGHVTAGTGCILKVEMNVQT
ncbi:PTS sugar transporter subunit IIA [Paenibacillus sp. CMAA1364]